MTNGFVSHEPKIFLYMHVFLCVDFYVYVYKYAHTQMFVIHEIEYLKCVTFDIEKLH